MLFSFIFIPSPRALMPKSVIKIKRKAYVQSNNSSKPFLGYTHILLQCRQGLTKHTEAIYIKFDCVYYKQVIFLKPLPLRQRLSSASSLWMVSFRILFFSFSFSYFLLYCSAVSSRFTDAVFLMVLALRNVGGIKRVCLKLLAN